MIREKSRCFNCNHKKSNFLTLFFTGKGKFYHAKFFFFNIEKSQQAFGLPQFFREPNLVLKVFWKFQVNSMPLSTLMTILCGDVIRRFLKQNFLYCYKNYATSKCHNLLNICSFLLIFGTVVILYKWNHFVPSLLFLYADFLLTSVVFCKISKNCSFFVCRQEFATFFSFRSFFTFVLSFRDH